MKLPTTGMIWPSVRPELHRTLEDYARVYEAVHGVVEPVAELVPAMLAGFLETDRGFARARHTLSRPGG